jgi:hypothetical protein
MNPLYIAGAAVLAYFAAAAGGASASTLATQQHMVFKDYAWQIILPSTRTSPIAPGTLDPAVIAALPPPPGASASSGHWFEMPQGMQLASPIHNAVTGQIMTPGTSLNPILQPLPPIPAGQSYYVWKPNKGTLQNFGGYWVTSGNWIFAHASQTDGSMHGFYPYGHGPAITWTQPLPPPPGTKGAGKWHQAEPGYFVWLTPTNANTGELAAQVFNLPTPSPSPATSPAQIPPPAPQPLPSPPATTTTGALPTYGYPGHGHPFYAEGYAHPWPAFSHHPHFA